MEKIIVIIIFCVWALMGLLTLSMHDYLLDKGETDYFGIIFLSTTPFIIVICLLCNSN